MMIARCEKECRDGGVQTDMMAYQCVRLCSLLLYCTTATNRS